MTVGRVRVWRHRGIAYAPRNIQETVPFGGGSVMVWGCVSHDCRIDLTTVQGSLTGQAYQTDILESAAIPHFDNHPLLTRPILMDDNARPHRSCTVIECLRQNAVSTIPWPAHRPDLDPIEHLLDILGRKVRAMNPPAQNLAELEAALHIEWRQIPNVKFKVWSRVCGGVFEQ